MNDLGLSMTKSSAEHAERTAAQNKKMIVVGLVGVAIAAIGILVSTAFSVAAYFEDRYRDASTAAIIKQVSMHLEASQNAFAAVQRSADEQRSALQAELRGMSEQRSALQAELRALANERQREQKAAAARK
jgi:hypothetical protein